MQNLYIQQLNAAKWKNFTYKKTLKKYSSLYKSNVNVVNNQSITKDKYVDPQKRMKYGHNLKISFK